MMQFPHLLLALILVGIAGCKPAVVQPEAVEAESDPFNEPATRLYTVLNDPWNTYFRTEPKILALPALSTGIAHILTEEQKRIKAVLDLNAAPGKSSDYAELDDRLADLKSYIPSAEVSSGYVRTGSRTSGAYSYSSGDYSIARTGGYYSGYGSFRHKEKSTSPELLRSVQSIVHNAALDDLPQRIDALQRLCSRWDRRIAQMSAQGTEGLMRDANAIYIQTLKRYTSEFVDLQRRLREAEAKQVEILNNKNKLLADWNQFESSQLNILHDYFKQNATVYTSNNNTFELPAKVHGSILYACEIGERTLYFDIKTTRQPIHPFVLVDITQVATE